MSQTVWVLTREINEYDQDGEYFEAVFKQKPTKKQLLIAGVTAKAISHVLMGGGRQSVEETWWNLREEKLL